MTKYEQASLTSQELTDALHRELSLLFPTINRNNAVSLTSFGADGYSKFAFVYLSTKGESITVFFFGNENELPSQVSGMPVIKRRNKMESDWAKITPFYVSLSHQTEVAPFARFLIDYSLPRAVSKRRGKADRQERQLRLPEEVSEEIFKEGHATQVVVNRYERDSKARVACLRHHGVSCAVCGINMESAYGEIARGFIHVHHLVPLALRKSSYVVDPKCDLIPICPNCHAVAHLANPPLSIDQLKLKLKKV